MSLWRSFVSITRSSRLLAHRGACGVVTTRGGHELRPGVGLAVASTLGLSLAAYFALVVDPLHADQSLEHEHETKIQAFHRDEEIRALRSRKSVDSFALERGLDTEALLKRYEESYFPPSSSGVARYDITQVARLV